MNGRSIQNRTISGSGSHRLDRDGIAVGFYNVRIDNENVSITHRLIVK